MLVEDFDAKIWISNTKGEEGEEGRGKTVLLGRIGGGDFGGFLNAIVKYFEIKFEYS